MKKSLVVILTLLSMSLYSRAQIHPHAIGLRFGSNGNVSGAEVSFQQGLSRVNRIEFDLGFGGNKDYSHLVFTGIYHWDWNITEGLNWYVGPGAGIGFYSYDDSEDYINFAMGGQIGLEYDFNSLGAPILLSLDTRPMWDFLGENAGFGWGMALGVRYIW
jgi:hypothetical protein